jgi:hypothetical protein
MLMVIFGAGASYDSSPTYTPGLVPPGASSEDHHNAFYRPPLAKELFANRPLFIETIEAFQQCKTIVPRLRAPAVTSGERSIETLLQEIEKEAETYSRGRQELAAVQCYLQRAILLCEGHWLGVTKGITNYLYLLREIERTRKSDEPVCLVTFNYDTLLEDALERLGHKISQMEDYIDKPTLFRVFKPHGSINWGQRVEIILPGNINTGNPPSVLNYLVEHAPGLRVTDLYVMCAPSTMGVVDGMPLFPAIAIPVEKKDQFTCPQNHVEQLARVLRDITKILVIGWRATEANFLELLGNQLTGLRLGIPLYIVAGAGKLAGMANSPGEATKVSIFKALSDNPPQSPTIDPGGFTDFLESGRAKSFLES